MRKRYQRDLGTLLGVVVILAAVVLVNGYLRRDSLREMAIKMRAALEAKHRDEGVKLMDWDDMRKTKGRREPTFPDVLKERDGRLVNLVGFMTPIDQFTQVSEFMLLPMPITCYFCERPPMRDIVEVQLSSKVDMVNEPVLIGGRFHLNQEERPLFFYTLAEAKFNEAVEEEEVTRQDIGEEHRIHHIEGFKDLRGEGEEPDLLPGSEPPALAPETTSEPAPADGSASSAPVEGTPVE